MCAMRANYYILFLINEIPNAIQDDIAFAAKQREEAKKLKEMQTKAAGKGPLSKSISHSLF